MGSIDKRLRFSFRDLLPKSLFKRAFLIIWLPLILVQLVFTVVFLDRYLESVTKNMAMQISSTAKVISDLYQTNPSLSTDIASEMNVMMQFKKGQQLSKLKATNLDAWEDHFLKEALDDTFDRPFLLITEPHILTINVETDDGVLSIIVLRKKLMSRTTILVFIWVFGASIFFLIIASIFMRNQVRPIQRLAEAAERFGKGMDMAPFKVSGATEVRQAGNAFNLMRERIKRQITQRTDMLASISHDLRTPLTRMKLELAMITDNPKLERLSKDVLEMELLVNEYLEFVKSHKQEKKELQNVKALITECVDEVGKEKGIKLGVLASFDISLRKAPFKRAMKNLLENAGRYSSQSVIKAYKKNGFAHILIEDNGEGIPASKREEVFKPFVRLEKSRNVKTGGVGLGLSIAQDIVHSHGGEISLGKSRLGGLKVHIKMPL